MEDKREHYKRDLCRSNNEKEGIVVIVRKASSRTVPQTLNR